ncbi:MAG: OadG family protein, partial [Pseudobutyrivibrio sp.]|nr:OadG family protein [Pseudobutyrivibrio sp.]
YTLGEIMKKAALNTVMGILIVFAMLVVMSAVIKGFEIIPKIEKKLKESKETAEDVRPVAAAVPVSSSNNETDDLQLVAVIAAAIAASTGASTDSFVVRSIKKR